MCKCDPVGRRSPGNDGGILSGKRANFMTGSELDS
jgi:hypothetical protein